jgi:hypothetical protein
VSFVSGSGVSLILYRPVGNAYPLPQWYVEYNFTTELTLVDKRLTTMFDVVTPNTTARLLQANVSITEEFVQTRMDVSIFLPEDFKMLNYAVVQHHSGMLDGNIIALQALSHNNRSQSASVLPSCLLLYRCHPYAFPNAWRLGARATEPESCMRYGCFATTPNFRFCWSKWNIRQTTTCTRPGWWKLGSSGERFTSGRPSNVRW